MKTIRVTVFNCHFLNRERYSTSGSKTSSRNRTFKRKDNLLIVKAKNEKGKWDFKVYTLRGVIQPRLKSAGYRKPLRIK